jgi:hypothetical protein
MTEIGSGAVRGASYLDRARAEASLPRPSIYSRTGCLLWPGCVGRQSFTLRRTRGIMGVRERSSQGKGLTSENTTYNNRKIGSWDALG